jgi:nitrogen regulatory protein P-II 1
MTIKRITAIVPNDMMGPLEKSLRASGVPGVTIEHVHGYGEHPNFFRRDLMQENTRIQLFLNSEFVDSVVATIVRCAQDNNAPAGILAVESIDFLVSLTDGTDIPAKSLSPGCKDMNLISGS